MKFEAANYLDEETIVASFAEAWIEIFNILYNFTQIIVASFAEAWIEIFPAVVKIFLFRRLLRGGVD